MLCAPWVLAVALTLRRHQFIAGFHPHWQVRVAASTVIACAVSTWVSVAAAATVLLTQQAVAARAGGVILAVMTIGTLILGARHLHNMALSMRASRAVLGGTGDAIQIVIVDDDRPDAFAVPGRGRGLVVITTGLSTALTADERSAVIEHERAHLRHRHHFYVQVVELAACLNPILRSWTHVVRLAVERSADECAARRGRGAAARAVARAALVCADAGIGAGFRISGGRPSDLKVRLLALTRDEPPSQRWRTVVGAGLVTLLMCAQSYLAADIAQDHASPEPGEPLSTVVG